MTGYTEAQEWLAENAPEWVIRSSESTLVPGMTVGSPTVRQYEVTLTHPTSVDRWTSDVWLKGEGASILEAAMAAVGSFP